MPHFSIAKGSAEVADSILAGDIDACLRELLEQGYTSRTVDRYRSGLEHFSYWLTRIKITWRNQEEAAVRRFLTTHLPACDCTGRLARDPETNLTASRHLLRFLRAHGRIACLSPVADPIEEEVHRFDRYLEGICGLAAETRRGRRRLARQFLSYRFARGSIGLTGCSPREIRQFVTDAAQGWRHGSVAELCGLLRSYFRFRAFLGERTDALTAAVPTVARWQATSLRTALTDAEIKRFLAAFDCISTEDIRNYAMARCLVDLGLRVGEVVGLQLEDLNWHDGTLRLKRTKGKRVDLLPLPTTTGQAIVQYLQQRKARRANRALFVRQRPPLDAPVTVGIVEYAMRKAYGRAHIAKPWSGTHCLRHSLACHLADAGIPLKEIADVLRHRSLNTTMMYAKANVTQLAAVALPWPGRAS